MSLKRIAMISVHTSPLAALGSKKTGGLNVYVRELSKALAKSGVEVDIYTRRISSDEAEIDRSLGTGIRVIHVNAGPLRILDPGEIYPYLSQFAAGVIAFATKQGGLAYEFVYSHYWLSGWVANKLKEVWGTPFVQMFHTLGQMKNRIGTGPNTPRLPDVRVATETQIVHWADRLVAATPAEYTQLLWLYRADRRKIAIVPPGVDASHFRPIPTSEARQLLGMNPGCELLLFVGRIEPLKAIDTIFDAVELIRESAPCLADRICVAVIGGDPHDTDDQEMQRLQDLAYNHKRLRGIVDFLGAKEHELLPLYYAAASVVIVPSDYESFGMVALEAMASGTPVIASEVGGLAHLVKDKETGYLIPSRDPASLAECVCTIITSPSQRELLGKNAARLAEQYDWSVILKRLMPIFCGISSRHPA
jgi:D-inositol-3-phosphate glycosyltransferase